MSPEAEKLKKEIEGTKSTQVNRCKTANAGCFIRLNNKNKDIPGIIFYKAVDELETKGYLKRVTNTKFEVLFDLN